MDKRFCMLSAFVLLAGLAVWGDPAPRSFEAGGDLHFFGNSHQVTGTDRPELLATEVYGKNLTATVKGLPAGKYTLEILLAETYFAKAGERVFDIACGGQEIAKALDIVKVAGGTDKAYLIKHEFTHAGGDLVVGFKAVTDFAKYNDIRLLDEKGTLVADMTPKNAYDVPATALFKDAKQPVEARVKDLLGRMTMDEKIQQMGQVGLDGVPADPTGIARVFGATAPGFLCADFRQPLADNATKLAAAQTYLRTKTRLGIPALAGTEALHGVMLRPGTVYPQSIGLGATWNPALVKQMGSQIAQEASAAGLNQVLSPVLDLGRDPRYGRIEETYGECPTLVSRMGVAFITGFQGDNAQNGLAADKLYCMAKHFAGYSIPANGINIAPVLVGEREMRTHHLIPFEAAIREAHAMSVMPSYNSVDGVPSHANPWLLTELLRQEWGFQGYVYSDWGGIGMNCAHRVAANGAEAGRIALQSGVDLEAPDLSCFRTLPDFVSKKQLDPAMIDQAVSRILRAKFIAGLFDGRRSDGDAAAVAKVVHTPEHIATSRQLASEGIILLKNDKALLPLDPARIKSLAVIGPNAAQVQFGDYSWSKSNQHGVHLLQALQEQYAGKFKINYAKGCDLVGLSTDGFAAATKAAQESDVAVVVIGDTSMIFTGVGWEDPTVPFNGTVGEGFDVANPVPPGVQEELVKAIVATGKPTIVILVNGRPYCLPWMHDHVPAILEAFYPGEQQGNAIADILFGKVNPSGRLPVTLARSAGHIPCTYDYKPYGRGYYHQPGKPGQVGRDYVFDSPAPLWPFGFGLSYTGFAYANLKIETPQIPAQDGVLKVSFEVKNTGAVAGKVVPQLYWRQAVGEVAPPEKRLLRFDKLELQPGEAKTLSFAIPAAEFRSLTHDMKWTILPGRIDLQAGDNAEAPGMLKGSFEIGK